MRYCVQACTDIGIVKKTNQDSLSVKVVNTPAGRMVFAILCDGMGGLAKGEVASATVITAFGKWVESKLVRVTKEELTDGYIRAEWTQLIVENNEKIKGYGKKCGVSLGTTITVMLITNDRYYIGNVGDTRAYKLTSNSCEILTKDQTVVAREIEQGILTEEQAKVDPRRSVLLQCIGASDQVYPEFFFDKTEENVVYMLCSDGFRHEITPNEIHQWLRPENMVDEQVMKNNVNQLIQINKQRAERDNISVIVVKTCE